MWKKLGVTLIALLSTFSVVYAMNKDMFAASATYTAGGNITGRIGKRPKNLVVSSGNTSIGMKKGDKVLVGIDNPLTGAPLGFQLIQYRQGYTDYNRNIVKEADSNGSLTEYKNAASLYTPVQPAQNKPINSWFSMNSKQISNLSSFITNWHSQFGDVNSPYFWWGNNIVEVNVGKFYYFMPDIDKTVFYSDNMGFVNSIEGNLSSMKIVAPRDIFVPNFNSVIMLGYQNSLKHTLFIPHGYDTIYSRNPIAANDMAYPSNYWYLNSWPNNKNGAKTPDSFFSDYITTNGIAKDNRDAGATAEFRTALYLNMDDVVFATSLGTTNGIATISIPSLPSSYSSIYNATTSFNDMRVRVLDASLTATMVDLKNSNNDALAMNNGKSELVKGEPLWINANATGAGTLSVIIFDKDGNFQYYLPLEPTKGLDHYVFDTNLLPKGEYQIAVVAEAYDNVSEAPIASSAISDVRALRIVEAQKISYTAIPQTQATYEYDKNVEAGSTIGAITRDAGVVPIHYDIVADGDNSYQNFEIDGLDANNASSATSLSVKVKSSGAPDVVNVTKSLKAGTYKFCIVSKDVDGNPVTDIPGQSKVCTSLKVDKTASTISFADASKKDMAIGNNAYVGDITYSNSDEVVPGNITYTLTNGISGGILSVVADRTNAKKYSASVLDSYAESALPTTFDVNVTIAETDNYKSATTTVKKQFYIYKELSKMIWTPSKSGNFFVSDVGANAKVGTLLASGGVETYTYELAKQGDTGFVAADASDNSYFTIVNGTGLAKGVSAEVKTTSQLIEKTYKIQFKVTDTRGNIVYKSVAIVVNTQNQNPVIFKTGIGGTAILEYRMKFNETNRTLFAEGGSTGAPIEYYLADTSNQPSGFVGAASDYADIAKLGGMIKPKKVGTINVFAKSPGNATYLEQVSSILNLIIEQGEQSVKFVNETTSEVKIGDTLQESAIGMVTLTNKAGIGGITYKSSNPSIATVDGNGKVIGIAKGSVTITATINDSDSNNTSYNSNYETKSTTKTVNIYKGMSLTWNASSQNLKAVSSVAGDVAGTIAVTDNDGPITYALSSNTGIKNADVALFQLEPNNASCGIELIGSITAADVASHNNKFYIQVDVTDRKGTLTLDIEITMEDAENIAYFTEKGNKITSISKQYGETNNSFQLTTTTSNGGNVTYGLDATGTTDIVKINGTGAVTIEKVGKTTAQAVIAAGSGYDGTTIAIPVSIIPGKQAIAFANLDTVHRAFTQGATFHDPALITETSANTESLRGIIYSSTTPSVCSIDDVGTITMLTIGNCTVTAKNDDVNWEKAIATKTINIYLGMGASFTQMNIPQAEQANAQAGSAIGNLTVSGGQGNKTFAVSTSNNPKNIDASFFAVNSTGVISLAKSVNASDIANYYDTRKNAYLMHVQFEITDALQNKITTDAEVEIKGAILNASFDTGDTGKITKVYSLNGTFILNLSSNAGNGTPTYRLKHDINMPTDVIQDVSANGIVTIKNANDKNANPNPVMVEAFIPRSNGYEEETIETQVEITKASQTKFGFKNTNLQMSTRSSLIPTLTGKLSTGSVSLTSKNVALVNVKGNGLETNTMEGTTEITAIDAGDRNYNSAIGIATVTISSDSAYGFVISVPSATYGDSGLGASIKLNELESLHPGAIGIQTWSSRNPDIANVDNNGNITIYKAGSVEITCTQRSTGYPTVSSSAILVIKPKPITIHLNDKSKYVGENMPSFDMTISKDEVVGDDEISDPIFNCLDTTGIPVAKTTPAGNYYITATYSAEENPNYVITVTPAKLTVKQDVANATWFHLEGVTSGSILSANDWHKEDVNVVLKTASADSRTYDEISLNQTLWDASFITEIKEDENLENVYFRIHANGILSTSLLTTIKIDKTSPAIKSITGTQTKKNSASTLINNLTFGLFFKQGTKIRIMSEDIKPVSTKKVSGVKEVAYELYEIDRATGIIQNTPKDKGVLTPDASGMSELVFNDVGLYRVCAIASDNAGNRGAESCSDINIKKIDVDIDGDGENEFQDPENDGCPDINIPLQDEKGIIYKLNVDKDSDGIPDLNIDSDGDGVADINVDSDKDGKPDLYLVILTKWEPTFCAKEQVDYEGKPIQYCTMKDIKAVINVDTDKDGIPDININTTGDMTADINIDANKNGKLDFADSNITSKIDAWTPTKIYDKEIFTYGTMDSLKAYVNVIVKGDTIPSLNIDISNDGLPDLNIDSDGDGLPETNIDGNGDGLATINIDSNKDGIADENIINLKEWKPEKVVNGNIPYKTMKLEYKEKAELEDNGIIVRPSKPGGTFLPNFALKVNDITSTISNEDKQSVTSSTGIDSEVKVVYDVSLLKDGQRIQPDGNIEVRIPFNASIKNPKILMKSEEGIWELMNAKIAGNYYVFETAYVGNVSIVGDNIEEIEESVEPIINPSIKQPNVKGRYTGGIGGAGTGDSTQLVMYLLLTSATLCGIITIYFKKLKKFFKSR